MQISAIYGFLALALPFVAAGGHGPHWSRRHQEVANRARGDVDVHKRDAYQNARFTFYDVGLGACGQWSVASDWIVALNIDQYGNGYPGPQCFRSITISYGGKTAQATIMDECMGCPWGGLDFSRGLFDYFASESEGVLYGTWWFNDDGGGGQPTSTTPPPTSTWQLPPPLPTPTWEPPPPPPTSTWEPPPPPPPTSTWEPPPPPPTSTWEPPPPTSTPPPPPPPTSTWTPPPSSTTSTSATSTSTSTSSSTSSSIDYNTGLVSGLAAPTGGVMPAPSAGAPENLVVINDAMIWVGVMLTAAKDTNT
ncbi:plant expansin [Phlebopus sp. FC_14]|nr:plant expansin [Phlebopus sp. FC_14]